MDGRATIAGMREFETLRSLDEHPRSTVRTITQRLGYGNGNTRTRGRAQVYESLRRLEARGHTVRQRPEAGNYSAGAADLWSRKLEGA